MKHYNIADTVISAELDRKREEIWKPFLQPGGEPSLQLTWHRVPRTVYCVDVLEPAYREQILQNGRALLFADQNWTKATLYAEPAEDGADALLTLLVYSHLVTRRTLLLHSSLVDYRGSGVLFLGPSGIGKTTQAELWNRHTGADILNGDLVFVRENEDGFYGYGSPWHGSSPYYRNARVKLKALVTLEQAQENTLRKLSGFEVMRELMDQVFLPHWYPEAMDACLDTLDGLLTRLPVYHLACRPDASAVRLLQKELNME